MVNKIWVLNAILCCSALYFVSLIVPLDIGGNVVSEFTCESNTGTQLTLADCCYTLKTQCGFDSCSEVVATPNIIELCKAVYE